jgi:bacterioferritin (cytochrome b1)
VTAGAYAGRVLSRRTAIAAGASALLAAGCGGRPPRQLAGCAADLPILGTALELARGLVALYGAGLRLLAGAELAAARQILEHEHEHAQAVAEAIRELGGKPGPPRPPAAYLQRFRHSPNPGAWVQNAIMAEEQAASGYAAAIPRLANPRLRATFAAIMTSEAEHAVALDLSR